MRNVETYQSVVMRCSDTTQGDVDPNLTFHVSPQIHVYHVPYRAIGM
jgi:hypothetical protein